MFLNDTGMSSCQLFKPPAGCYCILLGILVDQLPATLRKWKTVAGCYRLTASLNPRLRNSTCLLLYNLCT